MAGPTPTAQHPPRRRARTAAALVALVSCALAAGCLHPWDSFVFGAESPADGGPDADAPAPPLLDAPPVTPCAAPGALLCRGACVDAQNDPTHCGACDTVCPAACVAGRCRMVTQVAAAQRFSCALLDDGSVWCWGLNGFGVVGDPLADYRAAPARIRRANGEPLTGVRAIAAALSSACAARDDGTLWCWGRNLEGELAGGTIDTTMMSHPAATQSAVLDAVELYGSSLSGAFCAVVGRAERALHCWGLNHAGQAGTGTRGTSLSRPTPVTRADGTPLVGVGAVGMGIGHACALLQPSGEVYCWGSAFHGALGNGTTGPDVLRPATRVVDLPPATHLAAARDSTCARGADGQLYCWGRNDFGQLGDRTTTSSARPVRAGASAPVIGVSGSHACRYGAPGVLFCWGLNDFGQLGIGTVGGLAGPSGPAYVLDARVVGDHALPVTQLAFGQSHTCARTEGGAVLCWGDNSRGQIGTGSIERLVVPLPTPVRW